MGFPNRGASLFPRKGPDCPGRTLWRMLLVGPLNRPRKRKRTNLNIRHKSGNHENRDKTQRTRKDKSGRTSPN